MDTLTPRDPAPLTAAPQTAAPLTAADRCDRCGARAQVRAVLPSGGDLLFCAHHGAELRGALQLQGAVVVDEAETRRTAA